MRYWKKEVPETALHLASGQMFRFEPNPDGYGYMATDDGFLNSQFSAFAQRRVGGVIEITQDLYEEAVKKNADMTRSEQVLKETLANLPPPEPKVQNQPDPVGAIVAGRRTTISMNPPAGLVPPPVGKWRPKMGPPPPGN